MYKRQALSSCGVRIRQLELTESGYPDLLSIRSSIESETRVVYIQKSRGYAERRALVMEDIVSIVREVREKSRDAEMCIRDRINLKLPNYKQIRFVNIRDSAFPKTPTGKIRLDIK